MSVVAALQELVIVNYFSLGKPENSHEACCLEDNNFNVSLTDASSALCTNVRKHNYFSCELEDNV